MNLRHPRVVPLSRTLWIRFRGPIFSVCEDPSLLLLLIGPPCPSNGTCCCWSCVIRSPSCTKLLWKKARSRFVPSWETRYLLPSFLWGTGQTCCLFLTGGWGQSSRNTYDCGSKQEYGIFTWKYPKYCEFFDFVGRSAAKLLTDFITSLRWRFCVCVWWGRGDCRKWRGAHF